MKLSFKKIAAIAGSVIMAGATMGFAAAANYPAPFVSNGVGNVAIVTGSGAGVSALDTVQAGNIQTSLGSYVTGGTTSVNGENVPLDRSTSLLHLGNGISQVFGRSVLKGDMPTLLADGTYRDGNNNDHDYTQKIDVSNLSLSAFNLEDQDSNVTTSTPVIGFPLSNGENVLNYTLTFSDPVTATDMNFSSLDLMGSSYYVLSATNSKITLLDSGVSASLATGGSTTLTAGDTTYSVSVAYVDSSQVKLTVNGETTNMLEKGDTYKLSDGSYIGIKNVYSNGAPSGSYTAGVDFSIGSGKITMSGDGSDVQINGNSVDGVTSTFGTSGAKINSISIQWGTSDVGAITSSMPVTMPAFDGVKLAFSGMNYPKNETTTITGSNTAVKLSTVLANGPASLYILAMNKTDGNFTYIGQDSNNLLATSSTTSLNNIDRNDEFVVSWNNSKSSSTDVYKLGTFSNSTGTPQVTLNGQYGSGDVTLINGQAQNVGVNGALLTASINYSAKTVNLTSSDTSTVSFDTVYTADGLKISLPTSVHVDGNASLPTVQSYPIQFVESNKDGTVAGGSAFSVTAGSVGNSGSKQASVTAIDSAGSGVEEGNSNVYDYNVVSPLATKIKWDQGPTQETATVEYHGGESYGTLYLSSPSATISGGSSLGNVIVKDTDVSSVSGKNLIIVGGSCINSAAATALGVPDGTCGDAFTAATGVGAGQFLIKGVQDAFSTGKLALVVAGYDAADTVNAATYLTKKTVDTSKTYKGTSGTEATLTTA